jgi:hypothetical protein
MVIILYTVDSDDDLMIQATREHEANGIADEEEHLRNISCLLRLQAELNATPKCGGSKFGRRKTEPRLRMEGHCILYICQ